MPVLLIVEAILHTVLLILGVAAFRGCRWAFIVFLVMLGLMIVIDVLIAIVAIRNGKDVGRWKL